MDSEIWKSVDGFDRYIVSNFGRVQSVDHVKWSGPVGFTSVKGRILKWGIGGNGYPLVSLGFGKKQAVHLLVARAFLGECPDGFVCCHNDGDKLNSHISNLRYDTRSENNADEYRHGKRDAIRDSQRSQKAAVTRFFRGIGICRKQPEYDL